MRLSVIIPVFNAEEYIACCLESVIECPYEDMECIVINDGSRDASLEICHRYAEKDSRISVTTIVNSGVSVARNIGIEKAKGTYIMFLDADDRLKKDIWEFLSDEMVQQFEFIGYAYDILDENQHSRPEYYVNLGKNAQSLDYTYMCRLLFGTSQLNTCWGKLYLRQVIEEHAIKFRKELKIGEDAIFVLDYLSHVKKIKIDNYSLLYYRQHAQSAMKQIDILGALNDLIPLIKARNKRFKQWNMEENLKKELLIEGKRLSFSILTNLYRKTLEERRYREIKKLYTEIAKTKGFLLIFELVSRKDIKFGYKRVEYVMIRCHLNTLMILYYKIKCRLGTLR